MTDNFNKALTYSLEKEFAWLEGFDNPDENHIFSEQFETNMRKIFAKSEYTYVSVGRRRIRKSVLAALIALMLLAATGCGVAVKYIIEWKETQNTNHGTLDVMFEIKTPESSAPAELISPKVPAGFEIVNTDQNETTCTIEYQNSAGEMIYYSQDTDIENMSLSIDNEDAAFTEITINDYKGYSYSKEGVNSLLWTDGRSFYTLQGTCKMSILEKISESIHQ